MSRGLGDVYKRQEKHNTKRHLNEYTSLDFEMGYINGFEDIMEMETGFLQYAVELLKKDYAHELSILKVELPKVDKIPAVRFDKAKELVAEKGMYMDSSVIAHPDKRMIDTIL